MYGDNGKWGGILWTTNSNGSDDDKGGDESNGDEGGDYFEDDDNDDDEDNDLDESEYKSSDVVFRTEGIPIIEVKHKWKAKTIKAEEILSMVLFITSPWLEKVLWWLIYPPS